MAHQCPRCELRFITEAELRDHLDVDHAVDTSGLERFRYPARTTVTADDRHDQPRRVLVVANQTLGGPALEEAIRERVKAGRASFFVLVPATHSAHLATAGADGIAASADAGASDDKGVALARFRLRSTIDTLRAAGVDAEGAIGHPDPVQAVADLLHREDVDEIIVSTLPKGLSRWLEADLATQLERRFHLPVTSVVSEHADAQRAREP